MTTVKQPEARDIHDWARCFKNRSERLLRLIDLNAPVFVIHNEVELIRKACDGIEKKCGDFFAVDPIGSHHDH